MDLEKIEKISQWILHKILVESINFLTAISKFIVTDLRSTELFFDFVNFWNFFIKFRVWIFPDGFR